MITNAFDYAKAFSRNIGWITETEQALLRSKRVAIAGMGGVGGVHLLTLARLGIGAFHIADLDTFELANFNRQVGATIGTLGQPKVEVLARQAWDINPELDVRLFTAGVTADNLEDFLGNVDLFVDGLDFFVPEMRSLVFEHCHALGIPAITAGPIGMGAPYLIFMPGGMSFEQYFRLHGLTAEQQYVNFLLGLTPTAPHRKYLVEPGRLNLGGRYGPSMAMACQICAGIVGIEALKILLHRSPIYAAPYYHIFDAYWGRYRRGKLRWGNAGPWQWLKCQVGYHQVARQLGQPAPPAQVFIAPTDLERILDVARWAPSGDNSQPWRFEPCGDDRVRIHMHTHAGEDTYEYNDAQPTQLAMGCLLETLRVAASAGGRALIWTHQRTGKNQHLITAQLPKADIQCDPLHDFIRLRTTDRRRYQTIPLDDRTKKMLAACLDDELHLDWYETPRERWRMASLTALASDIRLRIPETFAVHRRILDWKAGDSPTGIPAEAIGLDPLALKIMRWTMNGSWERVDFMNRFLGGTLLPQLELDWLPGLCCAAHFVIVRRSPEPRAGTESEFLFRTGQQLQRFWLTTTRLGLVMQPAVAPLCFAYYGQHDLPFTRNQGVCRKAQVLACRVKQLASGYHPDTLLFMGRLGYPLSSGVRSRSVRRPLAELLWHPGSDAEER